MAQTEITRESVIVPIGLIKYYTGDEYLRTFYVQADRPEDVPQLTKEVVQFLEQPSPAGREYRVENLASLLDSARKISMALTVILIVIAMIALTISGIGIMNIMLVTVTERTREIGIRKAIGAPRDAILYQFLMEALLISGTGALVGIAIAVAIPVVLNFVISLVPEAAGIAHSGVVDLGGAGVFGIVFHGNCCLVICRRIVRRELHPTESLRYE